MAGDLATRGMPYGEEFCKECCGARDPTVVAAQLDEEENEYAETETDDGDVKQVLYVSVPRAGNIGVGIVGRRRRQWVVY